MQQRLHGRSGQRVHGGVTRRRAAAPTLSSVAPTRKAAALAEARSTWASETSSDSSSGRRSTAALASTATTETPGGRQLHQLQGTHSARLGRARGHDDGGVVGQPREEAARFGQHPLELAVSPGKEHPHQFRLRRRQRRPGPGRESTKKR